VQEIVVYASLYRGRGRAASDNLQFELVAAKEAVCCYYSTDEDKVIYLQLGEFKCPLEGLRVDVQESSVLEVRWGPEDDTTWIMHFLDADVGHALLQHLQVRNSVGTF
jgi:hypothetical protein